PVVAVPAHATLEATAADGAVFTYNATSVDLVDGSVSVTCAPVSGSTFPPGATTVNCSASDTHGNTGTASFPVTVVDTTPPTLSVPANVTVEATSPTGTPHTFSASATDTCDGIVAVTCVPPSGSTFPLGATTVACTATDAHGNSGSAAFSVVVADTTAPVVTAPSPITVAATQTEGARGNVAASAASQAVRTYLSGASAADGADSAPVRQAPQAVIDATTIDATNDTVFPVGTTSVTFRFRDGRGNVGSASSSLTVTPPVGGVVAEPDQ